MPEITMEEFREIILRRKEAEGISFLLSLYRVLDELVVEEIRTSGLILVCKSGCSTCCNQLITCTRIEMDEIIKFIDHLSREKRIPLLRRMRDRCQPMARLL